MRLLIPDWNAPSNVGALCTTRAGGFSQPPYDDGAGGGGLNLGTHVGDAQQRVQRNRAALARILPSEPAWLTQVHGSRVVDAACINDVPEADASISTAAGIVCVIQTADCLPVLLCDAQGTVVGAAHAGWRGLANGVLDNTVDAMRKQGAQEILAWFGPAIGPDCFEVGGDVRDVFCDIDPESDAAFSAIAQRPGKYLADIYRLARLRLSRLGVTRCAGGDHCTVTEAPNFYSYRRDRITGRMASLVWIKELRR